MLVSRDFGAFETRQSCLVLSSGAQVLNLKVFHALSSGSRLSGCAAYERKRAPDDSRFWELTRPEASDLQSLLETSGFQHCALQA